jgi:hypothetical protein
MAVSAQLIRGAGGIIEPDSLDRLMSERHRLLRELRNGIGSPRELGCLQAMEAAVEESDRALRRIMINEAPCTKASTLLS